MKINLRSLLAVAGLVVVANTAHSQYQLPDPSFEDWNGSKFANAIQPTYWHYSNVNQFGFDFNFSDRQPGRTGEYCIKVSDQAMKVAGIDGGTSPGYVALGQPWAYVPSLTNIAGATAGTHGGIEFTARPDTISLWIKRGGNNWAKENYNIVFYMWNNTAHGVSYGSDNGCTSIAWDDEESDIRLALDANTCQTTVAGHEIGEAYFFERAEYKDWTNIKVPVYYMNSDVPTKCNLILSAGNYPAGKSKDGFYAGNNLYVDDVELIYSCLIDEITIGGRRWSGFDRTSSAVQTYSLSSSATTIPEIVGKRGIGRETNCNGLSYNFAGRVLSASEMEIIDPGEIDVRPTKIRVTAEDGSKSHIYQIQFTGVASNNPRLASIEVNGTPMPGFNAYKYNNSVALPYGTTAVPVVTASTQDANAQITITQATSTNGVATISCVAQDGVSTATYTIQFSVAQLSDVTLQDILLDGVSLDGFVGSKYNYTVNLPVSATEPPVVTWVSAYEPGAQTITLKGNTLAAGAQIEVSAPGAAISKTYKIVYKQEASNNKYLDSICYTIDGVTKILPFYQNNKSSYTIQLPKGTKTMPEITWGVGDAEQTVVYVNNGLNATSTITVTAGNGERFTYAIKVLVEQSDNASLAMIYLDGDSLPDFDPEVMNYSVVLDELPVPQITYDRGDEMQKVVVVAATGYGRSRLAVTAESGRTQTYVIRFIRADEREPEAPAAPADTMGLSGEARLASISINGVLLSGFDRDSFDYTIPGYSAIPAIEVTTVASVEQVVTYYASIGATTSIEVTALNGSKLVYRLTFPLIATASTDLSSLEAGEYELTEVSEHNYIVRVPQGYVLPTVSFVAGNAMQDIQAVIEQDCRHQTATIRVASGDKTTQTTYVVNVEYMEPEGENVLLGISHDYGFIDLSTTTERDFTVELPYGANAFHIDSWIRSYDEQIVMVAEGGLLHPTVITVLSGRDEEKTVYTITPVLSQLNPTNLLDLRTNGTTIPGFNPAQYTYVVQTSVLPSVEYTAPQDATVRVLTSDEKHVVLQVDSPDGVREYTVYFYYTYDYIPNANFRQWSATKYNGYSASVPTAPFTEVYNGLKPTGWMAPADAANYFRVTSTYRTGEEVRPVIIGERYEPNGDTGIGEVNLDARFGSFSIQGTCPGIITTGTLTMNLAGFGNSTSSVSGGIPFRNTPDAATIEAKMVSNNTISAWQFEVNTRVDGAWTTNNLTTPYSSDHTWQTYELPIASDGVIDSINVVIDNTQFANHDMNETNGFSGSASLRVRNLQLKYNNLLRNLMVNGVAATRSGNAFTCELTDAETVGLPSLLFEGEVADQQHNFTWQQESNGIRRATIRNYGENGSYTDYTLDVKRPLSTLTDTAFALQSGNDIRVAALSQYATITVDTMAGGYCIVVTPESGSAVTHLIAGENCPMAFDTIQIDPYVQKQDTIHADTTFYGLSTNAMLQAIRIAGEDYADFDPTVTDYEIFTPHADLTCVPQDANQHVYDSVVFAGTTHYHYVFVYAPAGNLNTYIIRLNHRTVSHDATLSAIFVDGDTIAGFDPERTFYQYTMPAGSLMPTLMVNTADENAMFVEHLTVDTVDLTLVVTYTVDVTAEDNTTHMTYRAILYIPRSESAELEMIYLNSVPLADFTPEVLDYTERIAFGNVIPAISYERADVRAQVNTTQVSVDNSIVYTLDVRTQHEQRTYTVTLYLLPSDNTAPADILYNGKAFSYTDREAEDYQPDQTDYYLTIVRSDVEPIITVLPADSQQVISIENNPDKTVISVISGSGQTADYTIYYNYVLSNNALLDSIMVRGKLIDGFNSLVFEYNFEYEYNKVDTFGIADVTWATADTAATVEVSRINTQTIQLLVTAEDGSEQFYILTQVVLPSSEARLSGLYVDSVLVKGFDPDVLHYTIYVLNNGFVDIPGGYVTATPMDTNALEPIISDGKFGETIYITSIAPNEQDTMVYSIYFALGANINSDATWHGATMVYNGDGTFTAVALTKDTQCRIFDRSGQLVWSSGLITPVDPNFVEFYTDEYGAEHLVRVYPGANGAVTPVLNPAQPYLVMFYKTAGQLRSCQQKIMVM